MDKEQMKARKMKFALCVIKCVDSVPNDRVTGHAGGQLLRSGTPVASNYRAACRARSKAEFIAKLGIVEEEADESLFWMEVLVQSGRIPEERLSGLMLEAEEILAIVVSSIITARGGARRKR